MAHFSTNRCDPATVPGLRAMSLTNLRKIKLFIEDLAGDIGSFPCPKAYFGDPNCPTMGHRAPPNKVNMNIINSILVQPLTKETQISLVAHIGGGRPDYFVSHSWGA